MPSAWGELKKLPEVFLLVTPKVRTKTPVWYLFGFVNSLFFVNCLELPPWSMICRVSRRYRYL